MSGVPEPNADLKLEMPESCLVTRVACFYSTYNSTKYNSRHHCEICAVKIPKHLCNLVCSFCGEIKHAKCQKLTRTDVDLINQSGESWICYECISHALPINLCTQLTTKSPIEAKTSTTFKSKCSACHGYSYVASNTVKCNWCNLMVHKKCYKNLLGCIRCCKNMIPGFDTNSHDLTGDYDSLSNLRFNPYHRSHVINRGGPTTKKTKDILRFSRRHDLFCSFLFSI